VQPVVRLGLWVRRGLGRIVPDPFAIAVALTVLVMVAALLRGRTGADVLGDWTGDHGLWALLVFTMQMCTMLVLGTALASAPPIRRLLEAGAGLARTPRQLVGLTAFFAIALAVLNWSLGIVGGALLARHAGTVARGRGWTVHYPLLCAAGYSGLMAWHGGISGSAPLKVTRIEDLIEVLGPQLAARVGVLDLSETIFGPMNLWVTGGLLVLGPLCFMALTPTPADDPQAMPAPESPTQAPVHEAPVRGAVERFERSAFVTWALALPMVLALGLRLSERGISRLDFDTVNLTLWVLALLAHGRPLPFLRACEDGVRACTGVILQFPLYAGIMGMMNGAGLSAMLAGAFAEVGRDGFCLLAFASAGLLNLLVPSGGGQWAVQGPILMEGALAAGVRPADAVMAMAYGDQWTNMLQPFWALPLLAITGVRARDIVGYAAIWMVAGGVWIVGVLWWMV
jgi:short-chain fatty acids transporter